jgi:hypothetical protein
VPEDFIVANGVSRVKLLLLDVTGAYMDARAGKQDRDWDA